MGKAGKPSVRNDESQSRISAFFQIGNSPSHGTANSKLFTNVSQTFKAKNKLSLHNKKSTTSSSTNSEKDVIPDTPKEKIKSNKTFYGGKLQTSEQLLLSPTASPRAGPSLVHIQHVQGLLKSPEKGLSPTLIPETPEKCSSTDRQKPKKVVQRRSFLSTSSSVLFKAGNVYQPGANRSKSSAAKGPTRSLDEALSDDKIPNSTEQLEGKVAMSAVLTDMGLGTKEQKLMGLDLPKDRPKPDSSSKIRRDGFHVRKDSRKRTLSKEESPHPKRLSKRATPKKDKTRFSSRAAAMLHNSKAALEISRLSSKSQDVFDNEPQSDGEQDDIKEKFCWGIKRSSLSAGERADPKDGAKRSSLSAASLSDAENSREPFDWGIRNNVSPTEESENKQDQPEPKDVNVKWGVRRTSLSSDSLMDTKSKKCSLSHSRARKNIFARNLSCDKGTTPSIAKDETPLNDILNELKHTNSSSKLEVKPCCKPKIVETQPVSSTISDVHNVTMDTSPMEGSNEMEDEDEALEDIMKELKEKIMSPEAINKVRSSRPVISPYTGLHRKRPPQASAVKSLTSPPDINAVKDSKVELSVPMDTAELGQSSVEKPSEKSVSSHIKDSNTSMNLGTDLVAALDTTMEEEVEDVSRVLSQLMSPIKQSVGKQCHRVPMVTDSQTDPPPAASFGRHLVTAVRQHGHDTILGVVSDPEGVEKRVILEGFWSEIHVHEGDIVNVLGSFDAQNECRITDSQNLIIVHPDQLISGTSVVSSVHCVRRSVLNEKFKGVDKGNIHMLYGSVIHSIFQKVLQDRAFSKPAIQKISSEILQDSAFLHQMYSQNVKESVVKEEIDKYIPEILNFVEKYVPPKHYTLGQKLNPDSTTSITDIADIEENVWSPRYGIKGKIDLTVEVKLRDHQTSSWQKKVLPLELKTGRATFSAEHKGQVTLYSMMFGDRRDDPEAGLLLYLKQGKMEMIPADYANKRGLLQMRNELAHYLHTSTSKVPDPNAKDGWRFGKLPNPVNREMMCAKCPQQLNCVLFQKTIENWVPPAGHVMESLIPSTLSHLSPPHLKYFSHWCKLLLLEIRETRRRGTSSAIWCKTGWEREQSGDCLSGMLLVSEESQQQTGDGSAFAVFRRKPQHPSSVPTEDVGLNKNDSLVVSAENRPLIALCQGYIQELGNDSVKVTLDRDLQQYPDYKDLVFRLDKCDSFSTMGSNFTNISRLLEDSPHSARLRETLIERRPPKFEPKLSKTSVEKVKDIFKSLNKPQKTAILKVLMSKDYVLIKGYPGTGKTSTIVSLVRILVMLGQSVLLTSYTHSAVDNILLKLKQHSTDFLRLGRTQRIHPDILPFSSEVLGRQLTMVEQLEQMYTSKSVVATTCLGTNHTVFSRRTFDVCIVDEASQVLQPTCFGPLLCSTKFVLVGDPLQLPPVVQSQEARSQGLDESLFARLDDTGGTYELSLQYRMNSSIMRLSNELVYDGALHCGSPAIGSATLRLAETALLQADTSPWIQQALSIDSGSEVIWVDTRSLTLDNTDDRTRSANVRNQTEARLVVELVSKAIMCGLPQDSIGVITPFRQQVWLLREQLRQCDMTAVEVNTVDQYQGRDKEMIIVSFVKHCTGNAQEMTRGGILNDLRRLNVAITRAKHKLILIGCIPALLPYQPVADLLSLIDTKHIIQMTSS